MSSPPSHRSCSHALCSHSPCLTDLGWDSDWASALAASAPAGEPGRVARVDLGFCTVLTAAGAQRASAARGAPLAVGDWVALIPCTGSSGWSLTLLPRRTALVRRSAGQDPHPQVLAANVDTVLVVVALGGRISPRLIDRYVALAWQSGVSPVVALTKADLASGDTIARVVHRMTSAAPGVPVHAVSARTGANLAALDGYLADARTVALLGPSGAGKSTLVNRLAGTDVATREIRADGRGRHTTTHRELVPLPSGGVLVDTPGLREVGLWQAEEGLQRAFSDITGLLADCRFTNCSHTSEPGCALLAAVTDGRVTRDRVASWQKLGRELDRLAARDDPKLADRLRAEQRRRHREQAQARKHWRKPTR